MSRILVTIIGIGSRLSNLFTAESRKEAYEQASKWIDEIGKKTEMEFQKIIIEFND